MLIDGRQLTSSQTINTELCILGGGPAGITLANELKSAFDNIVLLEAGGEQYETEIQALYEADSFPEFYPDPKVSRLRFLGGASNHWANNTSPFSKIDFEVREWVANSGWPVSYDEFHPYYEKAAQYCQTGNDGYDTHDWMPKLQLGSLVKEAKFSRLAIAKASLPPTRFYISHGQPLVESSNVSIYKYASLVDIEFDEIQKRIISATFTSYTGVQHKVIADKFVMNLGGLENARMLLYFNQKYNNKLGNHNDNVGRYFMDHPTMNAAHLISDEKALNSMSILDQSRYIVSFFELQQQTLKDNETINLRMPVVGASEYQLSDGISSFHILKNAFSHGELPDQFFTHIGNLVFDADMVIEAIARKEFDTKLFDSAQDRVGFQIPMMVEQLPERDNRIYLSSQKDRLGIPKLSIEWKVSQANKDMMWKSLELFARDMGIMSLGRLRLLRERSSRLFGDQMGFGHHHMGTTRMSENEAHGVVDKNCQVFGVDNLFIAGSSVFPTGSHVPPTLTITALAVRLADYLKETR